MAVKALPKLTVDSTGAQHLSNFTDAAPGVGSATFGADYGYTCAFVTDAPLHFGPAGVTNTGAARGALFPAGFYSFELSGSDDLFGIAPAGQTVHVEILGVGVIAW